MRQKQIFAYSLYFILIIFMFQYFLSVSKAATFLPEEDREFDSDLIDLSGYVFSDDDDIFFIDDMAFRKSDIQRSGFTGNRWTNGNVYYAFDSGLTTQQKTSWLNAAAEWSAVAALNFIQRTNQSNYIYVKKDSGNWSYVGMIGGKQEMGIASWHSKFTIVHEIGHALGMIHEHQRKGRDTHVTINYSNVQSGYEHNFTQTNSTNYGDYDFDSIMHYDKCSFSTDCPTGSTCNCTKLTISVKPPNQHWTNLIGQCSHLSDLDKAGMAERYGSSSNTPTPTQTPVPTHTSIPTNSPIPTSTSSPRPTNTPIPTSTPALTPSPTQTPVPTNQSTPTNTPEATQQPTKTPSPTPQPDKTFTATPGPPTTQTPTAPPCTDLGVRIDMPTHLFQVNDPCYLNIWMCNPTEIPLPDVRLFVILDAYGELFCAPTWRQGLDFYQLTVAAGETMLVVLPDFIWPKIDGVAFGLKFYAAITDPAITQILGDYDWWEFGWE